MKPTIFLDVTLCSPVNSYGRFREPAASIIKTDTFCDDKCLYISIRLHGVTCQGGIHPLESLYMNRS